MPLINISGLANGVSFWPMCVFTGVIHNLVPSRYVYFVFTTLYCILNQTIAILLGDVTQL